MVSQPLNIFFSFNFKWRENKRFERIVSNFSFSAAEKKLLQTFFHRTMNFPRRLRMMAEKNLPGDLFEMTALAEVAAGISSRNLSYFKLHFKIKIIAEVQP